MLAYRLPVMSSPQCETLGIGVTMHLQQGTCSKRCAMFLVRPPDPANGAPLRFTTYLQVLHALLMLTDPTLAPSIWSSRVQPHAVRAAGIARCG
jgi:hypothetical protein